MMNYEIALSHFNYSTKSTIADAVREFDQSSRPVILYEPLKVTKILVGPKGAQYELTSGLPPLGPDLDVEDLADALEAEREYEEKGKSAFMSYDDYRAKRLGQGV